MEEKVRNVPVTDVQCDEIWSFVGKKESRRVYGDKDFHYIGDAWTFFGINRNTKLVLAFELGKRKTESARRFMRKTALATDLDTRFQLSTDGFAPYNYAVGMELEDRCDYGQLVKVYASPTPEEQRRYNPAHVVAAEKTEVYGDPDLICTSHIEPERIASPVVQTANAFNVCVQQKRDNLKAALALHFAYYNFCRVHRRLKMTPARAAGITDRAWISR